MDLTLFNPARVRLTHAALDQDIEAVMLAIDAGGSPYEAMLMCAAWREGFEFVLTRTSPTDRDRFCQRVGASEQQCGLVRAHGLREQLRLLLP